MLSIFFVQWLISVWHVDSLKVLCGRLVLRMVRWLEGMYFVVSMMVGIGGW